MPTQTSPTIPKRPRLPSKVAMVIQTVISAPLRNNSTCESRVFVAHHGVPNLRQCPSMPPASGQRDLRDSEPSTMSLSRSNLASGLVRNPVYLADPGSQILPMAYRYLPRYADPHGRCFRETPLSLVLAVERRCGLTLFEYVDADAGGLVGCMRVHVQRCRCGESG